MQHLLSKEKYMELKAALIKYNSSFDPSEQRIIQEHTERSWDKLCREYFTSCQQDPQWVKLHDLIKDYEAVTSFNMENHFRRFVIAQGDNYDATSLKLEYDPNLQQECRDIYHHIDEYTKSANQKLTHINSKKYVFRKNAKIKKIKDELSTHQAVATRYAALEKQADLKRHYLVTNTAEYEQAKIKFDQLNKQHANQIIARALEVNPGIICIEHNADFVSNDNDYLDSSYLNQACNDIKDIIMEMIVLDHEAAHEQENGHLTK